MIERPNFFQLKGAKIPRILPNVSLDTLVLEKEMRIHNGGIDLADIDQSNVKHLKQCQEFVPHIWEVTISKPEDVLEIVNQYPDIQGPCSMEVSSVDELASHMSTLYQIGHFHYILGKTLNFKKSFPRSCCGLSSRNVMLSLFEFGYANAAQAYSMPWDHTYILLPFVFAAKHIKGTVVMDPTSDQQWDSQEPRNATFIKLGLTWEYITDSDNGADLYPHRVCSIDIARRYPHRLKNPEYFHQTPEFFKIAFSNRITIG
jgi:hypothetical protein